MAPGLAVFSRCSVCSAACAHDGRHREDEAEPERLLLVDAQQIAPEMVAPATAYPRRNGQGLAKAEEERSEPSRVAQLISRPLANSAMERAEAVTRSPRHTMVGEKRNASEVILREHADESVRNGRDHNVPEDDAVVAEIPDHRFAEIDDDHDQRGDVEKHIE